MKLSLGALLLFSLLALAGSACGGSASANEATIGIRYSVFDSGVITARVGEPIKITLRNDDPIEHEWIVGDADSHERHRTGTEPFHAAIPTEVTIPPFATRVTQVSFPAPGEYQFICHLPGHEAYGMVGTLVVTGD